MLLRLTRPLLIAAGTFLAVALVPELAQAGCCLERQSDSPQSPWIEIGDDFDRCQDLNDQIDSDNVYDEEGRIWWSLKC